MTILGFPCNQFGGQEPGTNEEIAEWARDFYDVNFPMFAKIDVNGANEAPLYTILKAGQPGSGDSADIGWNFEKFLVNPEGEVVRRWDTGTTPETIGAELADLM